MDSVAVLMSTYNGEKYLKKQIDTILTQKNVDVHLIVRDDGSTDTTRAILREYANTNERMTFIDDGQRLGVGQSFMTLLILAPECQYYSYSDQDDIWHEDKLICGIDMIRTKHSPILYCCNQNCVEPCTDGF